MVNTLAEYKLLERVRNYVLNDVNSKVPPEQKLDLIPTDILIYSFTRMNNDWKAFIQVPVGAGVYYEITYNSLQNVAIVNVYEKVSTQEAII
jgi:hypothetical protein